MSGALILTLVLAALVGVALGTLGGGGSILIVPVLTYVAGMDPKEAIATSLVVVGATSLASLTVHARHGRVRWRTGVVFGVAGMVGAFGGGLLGGRLPGTVLMIAFALMMLATATAMIRRSTAHPTETGSAHRTRRMPWVRTAVDGVVVGLVTGVVGAGGGFLIVPALALLGGLSMPVAVGTSLLVIAMKSGAGLAGYLTAVSLNWPIVGAVTGLAVLGALAGAQLAGRIPAASLQRVFGWFVLLMGVIVLAIELPTIGSIVVAAIGTLGLLVLVVRAVRGRGGASPAN